MPKRAGGCRALVLIDRGVSDRRCYHIGAWVMCQEQFPSVLVLMSDPDSDSGSLAPQTRGSTRAPDLFSGSSDGGEKAKACSRPARPYTMPLLPAADVGWAGRGGLHGRPVVSRPPPAAWPASPRRGASRPPSPSAASWDRAVERDQTLALRGGERQPALRRRKEAALAAACKAAIRSWRDGANRGRSVMDMATPHARAGLQIE